MSLSKCVKYIPFIAILSAMLWIAAIIIGGGTHYSDSTFVFANQR